MISGNVQGRLYPYFMAAFVAVLLVSNTVAVKLVPFGPFVWAAAIVIFPVSYILGDVITEVYGYAGARRILWIGIAANVFMALAYGLTAALPALDPKVGEAFSTTLNQVPRVAFASICGIWCGQFANAFVMSRMKVLTRGRWLWARCAGSTLVGETVDTAVFATLAFAGQVPWLVIPTIVWSAAAFKTLYELAVIPLTYRFVAWVKRVEGFEVFDLGVSYNPFGREMGGEISDA